MLRKWFQSLQKRSRTRTAVERASESPEQKTRRLVQQKEMDNFWKYTGDKQTPIDPSLLSEDSH